MWMAAAGTEGEPRALLAIRRPHSRAQPLEGIAVSPPASRPDPADATGNSTAAIRSGPTAAVLWNGSVMVRALGNLSSPARGGSEVPERRGLPNSCNYDAGDCCSETCTESAQSRCGSGGFDCRDPQYASLEPTSAPTQRSSSCEPATVGDGTHEPMRPHNRTRPTVALSLARSFLQAHATRATITSTATGTAGKSDIVSPTGKAFEGPRSECLWSTL
eukprot:scaffold819_cov239-Pinguiococcus_pyrenoidosus.AAC.14